MQNRIHAARSVVDLGCGGRPIAQATCAVDLYLDPVERGSGPINSNALAARGLRFVQHAIDQPMPFANHEFEFAYSAHVFEHVHDPATACNEMMRIAKKGCIITPYFVFDVLSGRSYHRWMMLERGGTLFFFEKAPHEDRPFGNWPNVFDAILNDGDWFKSDLGRAGLALQPMLRAPYVTHGPLSEVCLNWEGHFEYVIVRNDGAIQSSRQVQVVGPARNASVADSASKETAQVGKTAESTPADQSTLPGSRLVTKPTIELHMMSRDLEREWETVVNGSPDAWFYHSFAEQVLLEEVWPIQTMSFMLEWQGKIVAACPLQRFKWTPALMHSTNMGPAGVALSGDLSPDERREVEPIVYNVLRQFCERMGVRQVEIALPPLTPTAVAAWEQPNMLLAYGFQDKSTVTTVIDLFDDEDEIMRRFATIHKQCLKKTLSHDIEVFKAQGPNAVDDYYALHVETYTRTGVTPHPRPYFEAIYRHFVVTGKAHWFMARYQGRILGALNLAVFGNGSLYWTGAYSREGLALGVGRLLQWQAIRYAKAIGLHYHETGEIFPAAVVGSKEAGLSGYKRRFGGRVVPFRKGLLTL
jgi:SAM-dependent methyltransferase